MKKWEDHVLNFTLHKVHIKAQKYNKLRLTFQILRNLDSTFF